MMGETHNVLREFKTSILKVPVSRRDLIGLALKLLRIYRNVKRLQQRANIIRVLIEVKITLHRGESIQRFPRVIPWIQTQKTLSERYASIQTQNDM